MPPTGLQRDPYGVDTEGATIPRLKPWVTPTQPPRDYNHTAITRPHTGLSHHADRPQARISPYAGIDCPQARISPRRQTASEDITTPMPYTCCTTAAGITWPTGYRTRRHRLPAQIRHSSHSEMTPDIIDCMHYGSPIEAGVT